MALDTEYRPTRYAEVVGQQETIAVLKQFVLSGTGFHQSYVFCGGHGGGKTTLGRILARALLCEAPVEGEPCDQCMSCRSILESGASECFFEVDAATNSGAEDVRKITESLQYSTFSGKRRVWLFDEAHQLSKKALDRLLKPMEDSVPGGADKLLVCIFCTTEPEKMRKTIFSRCAPAFSLRATSASNIAARLAYICDRESITYEWDALVIVAEVCENHIRDSIKAVEAISKIGPVDREGVSTYLRLDANALYLEILARLGSDLPGVTGLVDKLVQLVSPATCYERLAEASMLVYRVSLGAGSAPSYWDAAVVAKVGELHRQYLVAFTSRLASRPRHATASMLLCDLAHLHHGRRGSLVVLSGEIPVTTQQRHIVKPPVQRLPTQTEVPQTESPPPTGGNSSPASETQPPSVGKVSATSSPVRKPYLTPGGTYVDPRAQRKVASAESPSNGTLDADLFGQLLRLRVAELNDGSRGSAR
jgi:DNA polymerase III subunit gamma/tau